MKPKIEISFCEFFVSVLFFLLSADELKISLFFYEHKDEKLQSNTTILFYSLFYKANRSYL